MGRLSEDGATRSFSSGASGYGRSEACVTFFLQRAQDAKRSYGTILGAFTLHHGMRDASFLDFSADDFKKFLKNVYTKIGLNPKDVSYYEAAGTASSTLDAKELNAAAEFYLAERENQLMIGSVKSNLGHTEGASSLVSLAKALVALNSGVIPPNLHYSSPNKAVPALLTGHLQVVTEPTSLQGDIVAVNDIGLSGGTMSHIVVRRNLKAKPPLHEGLLPPYMVPRLVLLSDRNERNLKKNLKRFEAMPVDDEYASLVNCLNKTGIKGHLLRAFTVWDGTKNSYNQIVKCSSSKKSERRPVCFVFSGMGSQWPAMGRSLLRLPTFEKTIRKCHATLQQKGINLMKILTSFDDQVFESILNCFVGIAAVQIALVDVLRTIGVEPDMMVGHSVGELGCAYADGCLTMEQTLLSAWARGKASTDATLVKGTMAAIGLGYEEIKNRLPPLIDVACHNSSSSCTLSGPADEMERFVTKLRGEGVFAKLVNVANIAYHSRYIKAAGPFLLNYLRPIIPDPKMRSSKWLSSSIPEDNWDSTLASRCSSEYLVNNLLSPVLFEEVSRKIPADAIMIEIAPHGLLQAIVRKSHSKAVHVPLTSRYDEDNLMFLLSAVGKIYANGLPVDIEKLYDPVDFPVSRGTLPLSNFFGWESAEFSKLEVNRRNDRMACWKDVKVDIVKEEKYRALSNHRIRGKNILPQSFIVHKVVKHFTKLKNARDATIEIKNMKFSKEIQLDRGAFEINIQLQKGTGSFCAVDGSDGSIIADGKLEIVDSKNFTDQEMINLEGDQFEIEGKEIFEFFESYGLSLENGFANLKKITFGKNGLKAILIWDGKFVEFLNGLFALISIFNSKSSNALQLVVSILRLLINFSTIRNFYINEGIEVIYDGIENILCCKGVKIFLTETKEIQNLDYLPIKIKRFIPWHGEKINSASAVDICYQIIVENSPENIKIVVVSVGKSEFSDILTNVSKLNNRQFLAIAPDGILSQEIHSLQGNIVWIVTESVTESVKFVSKFAFKTFVLSKTKTDYSELFSFHVNSGKYSLKLFESEEPTGIHIITHTDDYKANLTAQLVRTNDENQKFGQSYRVCLFSIIKNQSEANGIIGDSKSLPHSHLLKFAFSNTAIDGAELRKIVDVNLKINISWDGVLGSFRLFSEKIPNSNLSFPLDFIPVNLTDPLKKPSQKNSFYVVGFANPNFMGIGAYDSSKKSLKADGFLKWTIPENWTKTQSMTAPLLYAVASYIIDSNNAEIVDDSILINNGLLPLSRAIISMLEDVEIDIYVTVYGDEKSSILGQFPFLKEENVFDCSKNSFHVNLLRKTGGRGVFKVVNTFEDENMVKPCVRCVGVFGVYVQVSEKPMVNKFEMGMSVFLTEVLAIGITAENLLNLSSDRKIRIRNMVEKYIFTGSISSLLNENGSKNDDSGNGRIASFEKVGDSRRTLCYDFGGPLDNEPMAADNGSHAVVSSSGSEMSGFEQRKVNSGSAMEDSGPAIVNSRLAAFRSGSGVMNSGPEMIDSGAAAVDSCRGTMDSGSAIVGSGLAMVDSFQGAMDSGHAMVDFGPVIVNSGLAAFRSESEATNPGPEMIDSGAAIVDPGPAKVDSGPAILNSGLAAFQSGSGEINSGPEMIDSGAAAVDSGLAAVQFRAEVMNSGPEMMDCGPALVDSCRGTMDLGIAISPASADGACSKEISGTSAPAIQGRISKVNTADLRRVDHPEIGNVGESKTAAADVNKLGIIENSGTTALGNAFPRIFEDSEPTVNASRRPDCRLPTPFSKSSLEAHMIVNERRSDSIIWVEAVSWMLEMGARSVFALLRNGVLSRACGLRLQFLKHKFKNFKLTLLSDEALFDSCTLEHVSRCLDSIRPGTILFLSEGKNSTLAEALIQQLDFLRMDSGFICLGYGGELVCERRSRRGIRSLCVQMKSNDHETRKALEYLENLYEKSFENPVVTIESPSSSVAKVKENAIANLPSSMLELQALLSTSADEPKFVEIPTKSPRRQFSKEIQPLYVFPGLKVLKLRQIVRKLFHPALEARYGKGKANIGREFSKLISASEQNMYTILAEGYGGILAFQVASRLEMMGKIVRVVLVDSSPKRLQLEASAHLNDPESIAGPSFEISSEVGSIIEEKPVPGNVEKSSERLPGIRTTEILRSRLQSVLKTSLPERKIKRPVYLLNSATDSSDDSGLDQFCKQQPIVRTFIAETEESSVSRIAHEINTLVLHGTKDAAHFPTEDFLESNFIKSSIRRDISK